MNKFRTFFRTSTVLSLLVLSSLAVGDYNSATQRIASQIGTQEAQDAAAICDTATMSGASGGNLGLVNQFFCLANTIGVTGETTGLNFSVNMGQTIKGRIVVSKNVTINSVNYEWEAQVWACNFSTNPPCTTTAEYWPIMYVAWNKNASGSINNGVLAHNFGISSGAIVGSLRILWDTGSGSSTQTIDLLMMGDDNSPAQAMTAHYEKTGTQSSMYEVWGNASSAVNRTSLTWNTTANDGAFYEDSNGAAASDTPTAAGCFTRSATATDFNYAAAGSCAGVTSTLLAYPTATANDMVTLATANTGNTSQGVDDVTTFPGDISPMHGMSLHPSSL